MREIVSCSDPNTFSRSVKNGDHVVVPSQTTSAHSMRCLDAFLVNKKVPRIHLINNVVHKLDCLADSPFGRPEAEVVIEQDMAIVSALSRIKLHVILAQTAQVRLYVGRGAEVTAYASHDSQVLLKASEGGKAHVTVVGNAQLGFTGDTEPRKRLSQQHRRSNPVELRGVVSWCRKYGVPIMKNGTVVLYKAVNDCYRTSHMNFPYLPGSIPEALKWDNEAQEYGVGLHFSPSPRAALAFDCYASKFIACPVKLSTIKIHPDGFFPEKCKAPRVCAPCWEVDMFGNKIK